MRPTIAQVMTRHPHSIRLGESLSQAERMMEKLKVHHLPVRDGGRLVGVLSDSDIAFAARISGGNVGGIKVEEACIDEPVSLDIDTDLGLALRMMLEKRIDSVLITEEGELCGIFTLTDAARTLQGLLGEPSA